MLMPLGNAVRGIEITDKGGATTHSSDKSSGASTLEGSGICCSNDDDSKLGDEADKAPSSSSAIRKEG